MRYLNTFSEPLSTTVKNVVLEKSETHIKNKHHIKITFFVKIRYCDLPLKLKVFL